MTFLCVISHTLFTEIRCPAFRSCLDCHIQHLKPGYVLPKEGHRLTRLPRVRESPSEKRDTLKWRHNGSDSVSNHRPHYCFLNRLFRRRSKKISKLCVTDLCAGNSPGTGEIPAQMASNAENVSIWWRHHGLLGRLIPHKHGYEVWRQRRDVTHGLHFWRRQNYAKYEISLLSWNIQECSSKRHIQISR